MPDKVGKKKRPRPQHWIIRDNSGYESTEKMYERTVKEGLFNESRIGDLLKALAATALTYDEILGAYAKDRTGIHNELLAVHRESTRYLFWWGQNRYFTAEIAEHPKGPYVPNVLKGSRE